jgi:hypothetical protein
VSETEKNEHYGLVVHERPSRYLAAGSPTRCQRQGCGKPFDGLCIRNADRFFCSEACAQVGFAIDFEQERLRRRSLEHELHGRDGGEQANVADDIERDSSTLH